MSKITKATVKSFIRKNADNLYINVMDTGYRHEGAGNEGFVKAEKSDSTGYEDSTMGIKGAWFVNGSRDYFKAFEGNGYTGIEVANCCGHFILAIIK